MQKSMAHSMVVLIRISEEFFGPILTPKYHMCCPAVSTNASPEMRRNVRFCRLSVHEFVKKRTDGIAFCDFSYEFSQARCLFTFGIALRFHYEGCKEVISKTK